MQTLDVMCYTGDRLDRCRLDVHHVGARIDHWSSRDPVFWDHVKRTRQRRHRSRAGQRVVGVSRVEKAPLPKHADRVGRKSIDRIDRIMFGGDEDNIMRSRRAGRRVGAVGDDHAGLHQGFGVNLAVGADAEQFPKRPARHDAGRRQLRFLKVGALAGVVVAIGRHIDGEHFAQFEALVSQEASEGRWISPTAPISLRTMSPYFDAQVFSQPCEYCEINV